MSDRKPFLDLTRHYFKRDLGDITVFGVWVPLPDSHDDVEPALALVPRYRIVQMPVVVCLSAAYRYDNPVYMAQKSHEFCKALGFEPGISTSLKIANIINDHMSDLISMPPEPTETVVVGEAKVTNHANGTHRTAEILDHQPARL